MKDDDTEIVVVTRENYKDVARRADRPEEAIFRHLVQYETRNQVMRVQVRKKGKS